MHDAAFWKSFNDTFYGFEHYELTRGHTNEQDVGMHYALWLEEKCKNWKDYFLPPTGNMDRSIQYKWPIPEEFHYDAWIAERTNEKLKEYKEEGENFFLWASFFDPHPSYHVPEPWDTMYDPESLTIPQVVEGEHDKNPPHFAMTQELNPDFSDYKESGYFMHGFHRHASKEKDLSKKIAVYYGMVSLMDKYIGKILDRLDELGLADNTLVVFTTDHGHFYGHHGLTSKGAFHYEEMIKIPFIVRYPGKIQAGEVSAAMQSLVDLAPTFLSFAGLPVPRAMTGINQSKVWTNQQDKARDHIICEFHHETTSIHLKTYVDERYKLTVYFNHEYGELFDLQEDPRELNNLWDNPEFKDLKSQLLLKYIWAELGKEPMWMPRIAVA